MEFPYTTTVIWSSVLSLEERSQIQEEIELRKNANQTDGKLILGPGLPSSRHWATLADAESWRDYCNALDVTFVSFQIIGPNTSDPA
jgi:hypothetical protein